MKLWEKSEIAKVVLKRGISRIDNDRIAAELMVIFAPKFLFMRKVLEEMGSRCDIAVVCRGLLEET